MIEQSICLGYQNSFFYNWGFIDGLMWGGLIGVLFLLFFGIFWGIQFQKQKKQNNK